MNHHRCVLKSRSILTFRKFGDEREQTETDCRFWRSHRTYRIWTSDDRSIDQSPAQSQLNRIRLAVDEYTYDSGTFSDRQTGNRNRSEFANSFRFNLDRSCFAHDVTVDDPSDEFDSNAFDAHDVTDNDRSDRSDSNAHNEAR